MAVTFRAGNQITLLSSGAEFFPALIAAIDAAKTEVRLETYIYADDASGRRVSTALKNATARGVRVYVAVDGFGSPGFMDGIGKTLRDGGVTVYVYRPELSPLSLHRYRLRRLHRKLVCIDASTAFVGGINIIDDFNPAEPAAPRFDYSVCVQGPLLRDIHQTMLHVWNLLKWVNLGRRPGFPAGRKRYPESAGNIEAALVIRDNVRHRREIEIAYLRSIRSAQAEIFIANAYFLPGRGFRRALRAAARRGVKVTLLLEGRVEYRLQYFATLALYGDLLNAGIRIFEYRKSYMHAKVAVIDNDWATVGSSNIDPFSLMLSREANVVIRDTAFAAGLRDSLIRAMADGATEITGMKKLPFYRRILGWMAYGLVRFLAGVAGYGRSL